MIRSCIVLFSLLFALGVNAQELEFVDLGVVEGEFKEISKEVEWFNRSDRSVQVKLVSKNDALKTERKSITIKAGAKAKIRYSIELSQSPGYFEYELQLVGREDVLLHGFQFGLQILAPEVDVFKAYRNTQWPFRTKERIFNLKAGYKQDTLSSTFDVYNLGGADLDLSEVKVSDSVWVKFEPKTIKHNQFGRMTISMLPSESAPSGFQKMSIGLKNDDKVFAHLPIQFTLLPPKQLNQNEVVSGSPTITTSIINHDFKVMKVGEVESVQVVLANLGKGELQIERLESNCDCLTYELQEKVLSSGNNTMLTVTFNANNRLGLERKTLAIFSNDPANPTLVLTFRAHVK
ncbi:MAG: DUF1573 domain-containing protein [Roseivirga sp.]|jgi:hypothetical protein|uniref:DUF1573 domain-containing protein n=1 Tax=Roseivirga sp. TaxID=1964215 RepID=UPI001B130263|nr:DUF1573 domain-containing protein [Roseivirga sp.]MBO6494633.1 DUF1573 domain-containing protein [Roseivirga sp.]